MDDQFSGWWLKFQICRSRKLKLHPCSEVEPHLAITKELNDWLSDAVEAKHLFGANWGRKLHWLKPCFHGDQERHEELRRSSSPFCFYHSFCKCDENFCQSKLRHSSGVAFGEGKRIVRLYTQFSRWCLVIAQESIGKNSCVGIFEHLSMVELKCNVRFFCEDFF